VAAEKGKTSLHINIYIAPTLKNRYLYITLLAILGLDTQCLMAEEQAPTPGPIGVPRLVVAITIDQLRSDCLEAFRPLFGAEGFERLMRDGLFYTNAGYDFEPVDRASAVASLFTGVSPYYNSIVGQRWLVRETLQPRYCVDDDRYEGLGTWERTSPDAIATSTLGDELKMASRGQAQVWSIAPYSDMAVLAAGHAADGALWIDRRSGLWCSSNYYMKQLPKWLNLFNDEQAPAVGIDDKTWQAVNPASGTFSLLVQQGEQKPFKHKFKGDRRYVEYTTSGLVNADVTNLATRCVLSTNMGQDRLPDLLCLTYYAGCPDQQTTSESLMELQDTYQRLDQELARLLSTLERRLGKANLLVVVTGTGYAVEEGADYPQYRIPTGTFYMSRTANLLNMYFGALWGTGRYVDTCFGNQIFLNQKLLEQRRVQLGDALQRAQEFMLQLSGVRNVYTSLQLFASQNDQLARTRAAFNTLRSGDIMIEVAPGWHLFNEDTQEDQLQRAGYIQFPLMVYGASIEPRRVEKPVTMQHLAPAIAKAIRIRAPNACKAEPLF